LKLTIQVIGQAKLTMKLIPFSRMLVSMYMVFKYSEMNKITVNGIHNKALLSLLHICFII